GCEVRGFGVITDREREVKYGVGDYGLSRDIGMVDGQLVLSVRKDIVADRGMDVLRHGIEC
uniref:iron-containing alcohol dehydrogenase n=1 Tax=Staphylococcus epidermidis TaxID=1282 RepID=UPI0021B3B35C